MAITTLEGAKSYLGITGTASDAQITALIPLVEQQYLDIRNVPFAVDTNDFIVYPIGSDVTANEMIGYKLSMIKSTGRTVASESIDAYSISYGGDADNRNGYPKSIISAIKRYIDGR